jgi:hypothetical protein
MAPVLFRSTGDDLKRFLLTKGITEEKMASPSSQDGQKQVTKICSSVRKKRQEGTGKTVIKISINAARGGRQKRKTMKAEKVGDK